MRFYIKKYALGRESPTPFAPTPVLETQTIDVLASTLLQFFEPSGLVLMSLEYADRGIHAFGGDLDRSSAIELPRNAPCPYLVWRPGRRAGARFEIVDVLARFSLVAVGAGCVQICLGC